MSGPSANLSNNRLSAVASHAGTVAAITLACKMHRLIVGSAYATLGAKLCSIAADVSFVMAFAAVGTWLLSRPRFGRHLVVPFRIVSGVLVACALLDHGFFLTTGATLDWYIARYAVAHVRELYPILAHEGGRRLGLTAMFVIGIALAPKAIASLPIARRLLFGFPRVSAGEHRIPISAICLGLMAPAVLVFSSSSAESLDVSSYNVYFRLGKGALRELAKSRENAGTIEATAAPRLVEARSEGHWNVVLVVLESARAASFSPYGSPVQATPFFERLSRVGALVEKAYTVVPHTM